MKADTAELRTECPLEVVNVLDAVSLSQRLTRGQLVVRILSEWAEQRHREAILIARLAPCNPASSESDARGSV